MINEHDMTKKMMQLIRENDIAPTDQTQRGETESVEVDKDRIKEFETSMSDYMGSDSILRVNSYVIYPNQNKASMIGSAPNLGNMEFQYHFGGGDKVILNAANMELDDDAVEILRKIERGYENFNMFTSELLREYQ